jgi:transcription termination factor Rho
VDGGADASAGQADPAPASAAAPSAAPRTRRRATSGGLAAMVLPELQALAGELGITGVGRLRKSQLIEAIQAKQGVAANGAAPAQEAPAQQAPAQEADAPRAAPQPELERGEAGAGARRDELEGDQPRARADRAG